MTNPAISSSGSADAGSALSKRSDGEGHLYTSCSGGTEEALVAEHIALVRTIARDFHGWGMEVDDFVSEGLIELILAARRFDPTAGCPFEVYIRWHIRRRLAQAARAQGRVIRLPAHVWKSGQAGDHPDATSLDLPVGDDEGRRLVDLLEAPDTPVEAAIVAEEENARLLLAVATLPDIERDVILARYWAGHTTTEAARVLQTTVPAVKNRERRAIDRLRERLGVEAPKPSEEEQVDARRARDETVLRLRAAGETLAAIAKRVGLTPARVGDIVRAAASGKSAYSGTDRTQEREARRSRDAEVLHSVASGEEQRAVARRLGISPSLVNEIVRQEREGA